jgi:hypothetical protein
LRALDTLLSLLDENVRETVRVKWLEANLSPLEHFHTAEQAERALQIVNEALNAVSDDAGNAGTIECESDEQPDEEITETNHDQIATTTQVRAINTILSRRDVVGPKRHDIVNEVIDRHITSLDELTKPEATKVIDTLKSDDDVVTAGQRIGGQREVPS